MKEMDKFSELKAAAMAATPGPWEWFTSNSMARLSSTPSGKDGDVLSAFRASDGVPCVSVSQRDMAFIAAANPAAVLALLAELEAKDKRILELDYLRLSACEVFKEIGNELGCNPDNESIMMAIDALKERLATPVRLPTKYSLKLAGDKSTRAMFSGHNSAINDSADAIRAAGFTVEGDE